MEGTLNPKHSLFLSLLALICVISSGDERCYSHFFAFGDSLTDNGNWLHYVKPAGPVASLPYGETFFNHPTGRFSDGLLIIDFISEALTMPFLTPYLVGNASKDFEYGANFAVNRATALNQDYFRKKGLPLPPTPYSLGTQIRWFGKVLKLLGSSEQERRAITATSLFLIGEIGVNDYSQGIAQNRRVEEIRTYVPDVIKAIGAAINDLINLGAKTIVVPGIYPIGCVPGFLTFLQTNKSSEYDQYGCLTYLNEFAEYHNTALKAKLQKLSWKYNGVTLIYADYYGVILSFTQDPLKYGFDKNKILEACCGAGGTYNFNLTINCGENGADVCPDPAKSISWDGTHFTQQAYKLIATNILQGPFADPPILAKCNCN